MVQAEGRPSRRQREVAGELLAAQPEGDAPEAWLVAHMALWWPHVDLDAARKRALLRGVRGAYTASLSATDRLRREVLMCEASGSTMADVASSQAADPWGFRSWCASLPPWSDGAAWTWTLDQRRVRATTDGFWYERPLADPPAPWGHAVGAGKGASASSAAAADAAPADAAPADAALGEAKGPAARGEAPEAYDVGYAVPFLCGQLRILWAETEEKGAAEARPMLGPVLSALASSGALELLVLACAAADATVRACAFESLAIVVAWAGLWQEGDAPQPQEDRVSKVASGSRLPFRELPQLRRMLRAARDAMDPPEVEGGVPEPLPRLVASFLCACVPVCMQPQHNLYKGTAAFFLGRASMELADMPLFYKLLLSGEADCHEARLWLFRVIRRALSGPRRGLSVALPDARPGGEGDGDALAAERAGAAREPGGDASMRVVLARRYVVQWLLSFAGSHELGSFDVWCEAVSCLGAALADHSAGTPQQYGVAEWICGQVARIWPGASGRSHRSQVLPALTRLVWVLLRNGASAKADLLALGGAVEAILQGWAADVAARPTEARAVPVRTFWALASRLMELSAGLRAQSEKGACAVQLNSILQLLGDVSRGPGGGDGNLALAEALEREAGAVALFAQAVAMLEGCPLSSILHSLVVAFGRRHVEAACGGGEGEGEGSGPPRGHELDTDVERGVVRAAAAVLEACRDFGGSLGPGLRASTELLLQTLVALPLSPRAAWRAQVLFASALLALRPEVASDRIE